MLKDVATVVDGIENNNLAAWMGQPSDSPQDDHLTPAVILNIQRQPGANTIAVVKASRPSCRSWRRRCRPPSK